MKKFRIKSELIWFLKSSGIELYYGNKELQKIIRSDDNQKLFDFLTFLKTGRTQFEIEQYEKMKSKEKMEVLEFLEKKYYGQWTDGEQLSRTALFMNTFPNTHFNHYFPKINRVRIIIIGLGTAGSYLVEALSKLGVKHFILIDGDKVEDKNLESQFYTVE